MLRIDGVGSDADEIETQLERLSAQDEGSSGAGGKRKQGEVNSASNKKQKITEEAQRKASATVQVGLYAAEMFAANLMSNRLINFIIIGELSW